MRKLASVLAGMAVASACQAVDANPHAGDSNYAWNYTPVPPTPTLDSLVPGDRRITVYFTGSNAQYFQAPCSVVANAASGKTGFAFKSPIVVDSLMNNVEYKCSVVAFNSGRPSASSSAWSTTTPKAP